MRKRLLASMMTLVMLLSLTVTAFAQTFDVTTHVELVTTSPIYTGDSFILKATTLKNGPDMTDEWTFNGITKAGTPVLVGDNYVSQTTFTAPLIAGTYTVSYYIRMYNKNNEWLAEEDVPVTVLIREIITVENPAAPAVANAILKEFGVSHRYHISGKLYGNYISDVAKMMENGATFKGVSKDDVAAYKSAVMAYLIEKGAIVTP